MKLYPAILTSEIEVVQNQLDIAQDAVGIEAVQIDVIDGFFVDNLTVTPLDLVGVEFGRLKCDLHLMVDEPLDFVFEAVALQDTLPIRGIIAQVERMSYQSEYFQEVKRYGWKAGLSLDLYTPVTAIDESSWEQLDMVQIMGNQAGFQGEPLHAHALEKLKEVSDRVKKYGYDIEVVVDVGVTPANAVQLFELGATSVAMGSSIWKADNPEQVIDQVLQIGT